MRRSQSIPACILLFSALISFSFLPPAATPVKKGSYVDHYSIDPLPEAWKKSKGLVKAIDAIVTTSVKELADRLPCTDCTNSPYSVALLIDSPVIVKQDYEDISYKKNSGGFNYECSTEFYFKSSLAVYDINQHGIAKVLITNPEEDKYTLTKKFNLFPKGGAKKPTPEEYISQNASDIGPTMNDLMKYAEKKIYVLRDEVHKLYNRH